MLTQLLYEKSDRMLKEWESYNIRNQGLIKKLNL